MAGLFVSRLQTGTRIAGPAAAWRGRLCLVHLLPETPMRTALLATAVLCMAALSVVQAQNASQRENSLKALAEREQWMFAPGEVPFTMPKALPEMPRRKLYVCTFVYSAATLDKFKAKEVKDGSPEWNQPHRDMLAEALKLPEVAGIVRPDGCAMRADDALTGTYMLASHVDKHVEARALTDIARKHGMEMVLSEAHDAESALMTIDPGFSEKEIAEFWVAGRTVEYTLKRPDRVEKGEMTVNGEKSDIYTTYKFRGTVTVKCADTKDAYWISTGSSERETTGGGNAGGGSSRTSGGTPRAYHLNELRVQWFPRDGHDATLPMPACMSVRTVETLKLGSKEYACRKFTTVRAYLDAEKTLYTYSEFWFSDDVPGLPLQVKWHSVTPTETRTHEQIFKSTTVAAKKE
jgi:hypothetical protein